MPGGMPSLQCAAPPVLRILRRLAAAGLLVLLAGCSAVQFTYNHADALARYKAAEYVDLDAAQVEQFRVRFSGLQQWHRSQELPPYAALLRQSSERLARGLAQADVGWALAQGRSHYRLLTARAAREAAPILASLTERQVQQIERRFAENNRKYRRDYLEGDERTLRRKRTEQLEDYFREFAGRPSDAQRERLAQFADEHGRMQLARFEDRRRAQAELLGLLRSERDPSRLGERLAVLYGSPDEARPPEYQRAIAQYEQQLAELVADLDRLLSTEQRTRAVRRLAAYADEVAELARQGTALPGAAAASAAEATGGTQYKK